MCGEEKELTKDHIIPKSVYKRFPLKQIGFKKNLGKKNIQMICSDCNSKKSNHIDVSHPIGREFWTKMRDEIDKLLTPSKD
jgi:5-methylcytosine-specific restriction endonuclease McrA